MRGRTVSLAACAAVLGVLLCSVAVADIIEANISVAPHVLTSTSAGRWVTIRTDVPYAQVDGYIVEIDGVEVDVAWDKANLLGNLVIKLRQSDVRAVVGSGVATVGVMGALLDGTGFVGSDTIRVRTTSPYRARIRNR